MTLDGAGMGCDGRVSGVPAVLGSCAPGGDHTRIRYVLRCGTNVCRRPSAWSGIGLGTGVGGFCMLLPGRSGSLRSSWRVWELSLCSSAPEPSIRSGRVKTWTEAKQSDRGGDSRSRTGILARHYCRGAEPEDGCDFLAFTPHLLTQPPMSPGSSSSLGQFQLRSTQPPM